MSAIEDVTARIQSAIADAVLKVTRENVTVTHYGANDIHPRHLVYWIVVQSDREKRRLEADASFIATLRRLLVTHDYPAEGRDHVHIGVESVETVNRESNGNFWHHWK